LISSLERNNAEKSKLSNKFAHVLKVDPTWLAFGSPDRAPPDFDEGVARKGRETMGKEPPTVVRMPSAEPPRWAADSAGEALAPLTGADAMMKQLVAMIMDFTRLAGPERALALRGVIEHIVAIVSFEQAGGEQNIGAPNQRNDSANH